MIEVMVAAAVALILTAVAAGEGAAEVLFLAGTGAVVLGLATGVPAGIVYHVKLHRALSAAGAVEPGWWWRPTAYHDRVAERERPSMLSWFHAGAAGFFVVVAGCALVTAATVVP